MTTRMYHPNLIPSEVEVGDDEVARMTTWGWIALGVGQSAPKPASASSSGPAFRSGAYYFGISPSGAITSNTLGIGNLRVTPEVFDRPVSLSRIGAEVTTVGEAGSKVRLGIYADDGSGYPGALVVDAGQINGDSATTQERTIDVSLSAGTYWFGAVVQTVTTTQPTLRVINNWTPPIPMSNGTALPSAAVGIIGYSATGVTGALPSTFSTSVSSIGAAARIFFKVA